MPSIVRSPRGTSIISRPIAWLGFAAVAGLACGGQGDPLIPDHITVVSGANQDGHPYQALANSLVVVLEDQSGGPVPNYPLTWTVLSGGGTVTPASPSTDANGRSAAYWVLGGAKGAQTVTALVNLSVNGNFIAQAIALVPDHVDVLAGNNQTGTVGLPLETPLKIAVLDASDQPIPDVRVGWTVATGGGVVMPAVSNTDLAGETTTDWTLGPTVGAQTVTVTIAGLAPLTFTATGSP